MIYNKKEAKYPIVFNDYKRGRSPHQPQNRKRKIHS